MKKYIKPSIKDLDIFEEESILEASIRTDDGEHGSIVDEPADYPAGAAPTDWEINWN